MLVRHDTTGVDDSGNRAGLEQFFGVDTLLWAQGFQSELFPVRSEQYQVRCTGFEVSRAMPMTPFTD